MFFGEISITLKPKAQFIGCNLISVYHRYKDCEHSLQAWLVISSIYIIRKKIMTIFAAPLFDTRAVEYVYMGGYKDHLGCQ